MTRELASSCLKLLQARPTQRIREIHQGASQAGLDLGLRVYGLRFRV